MLLETEENDNFIIVSFVDKYESIISIRKILIELKNKIREKFGEIIRESEFLVIQSIMARRQEAGKNNLLFEWYQKVFF